MTHTHPGYATVAEIVRIYSVTPSGVYRYASEAGWRRYRLNGKIRYHRDDVADTLGPVVDRRHPDRRN